MGKVISSMLVKHTYTCTAQWSFAVLLIPLHQYLYVSAVLLKPWHHYLYVSAVLLKPWHHYLYVIAVLLTGTITCTLSAVLMKPWHQYLHVSAVLLKPWHHYMYISAVLLKPLPPTALFAAGQWRRLHHHQCLPLRPPLHVHQGWER
jgi:hypothetical protein